MLFFKVLQLLSNLSLICAFEIIFSSELALVLLLLNLLFLLFLLARKDGLLSSLGHVDILDGTFPAHSA